MRCRKPGGRYSRQTLLANGHAFPSPWEPPQRVKEIGWIDVSRRVWSLDRDELEAVCLCRLGNDDFGWAFEERSTGRKIAVEQGSLPRFHRDRCTTCLAWILAGFISSNGGLLIYIMDLLGWKRNSIVLGSRKECSNFDYLVISR